MKTSKQNNITSVSRNQNVFIRAVFERAGDTRKVLCVALDYVKRKHVALSCDGNGDIFKAAFPVENNPAGIDFLIKKVAATARRGKIPKNQIFSGGEDKAAYVANFTAALREKGYLVVRTPSIITCANPTAAAAASCVRRPRPRRHRFRARRRYRR